VFGQLQSQIENGERFSLNQARRAVSSTLLSEDASDQANAAARGR
jgi:hypothetical protein